MRPTFTICVPTIGRPTLPDTLASIARQDLIPGDQVLIVYDSFQRTANADATRALVEAYGWTFIEHDGGYHFYGNPQLNHAMTLATGDYFLCLGDDDVYVDGAFDRLRAQCRGRAVLFQFYAPPYLDGRPRRLLLWQDRRLRVANLSGCCMAAPRSALAPVSDDRRIEVDFDWIADMVQNTGQPPQWMQDCLIIARPDERNGETVHQGVATCPGCGEIGFLEDRDRDRLCVDCQPCVIRELCGASV